MCTDENPLSGNRNYSTGRNETKQTLFVDGSIQYCVWFFRDSINLHDANPSECLEFYSSSSSNRCSSKKKRE